MILHLKEAGIGTGIHYPVPLHLQKAYAPLGYGPGDFPVTETVSSEIISLPMFPQLTAPQQARVAKEILTFASREFSSGLDGDESLLTSVREIV
jgi:dTDP-4-amino-4,6-dideoxygalactose transaminase